MTDEIDQIVSNEAAILERRVAASGTAINSTGAADCVDCGEPIPAGRREAMPSARRCIICQTIHEKEFAP